MFAPLGIRRVEIRDAFRPILERLGLSTLEGVKAFRGDLVKDHRGRRDIFRINTSTPAGEPLVLFLKRNWRPYKKDGLNSLLRRGAVWSLSRQEWENSQAMQRVGLNTAGLVAYGEDCGPLWERFSFLITEAAPGGRTVEQFLRECRDRNERRRVFDALAREIRRLHDAGLATPDLFTRHIFVNLSGAQPSFCFIDMARLDCRRRLSDPARARDLAASNVTAPLRFVTARERVRFLKIYNGFPVNAPTPAPLPGGEPGRTKLPSEEGPGVGPGAVTRPVKLDRRLWRLVALRTRHLLRHRRFHGFLRNNEPNVK